MNKHSVQAGYVRGQFWTPLDENGSATVYKGPPMRHAEAAKACIREGDTGYWQLFNGEHLTKNGEHDETNS